MSAWNELFDEFARLMGSDVRSISPFIERARHEARSDVDGFWQWFRTTSFDERRKRVRLLYVLLADGALKAPADLVDELIKAAVYEIDPSFNRTFIEPCLRAVGRRAVNEALLAYVESGTNFEKAGAINALYWAQMKPQPAPFDEGDLTDLWRRVDERLLREFLANDDVHVRRSIIPKLALRPENYSEEARALIPKAIEIARASADDYVRQRVEIQLGSRGLLAPLPHRPPPEAGPQPSRSKKKP